MTGWGRSGASIPSQLCWATSAFRLASQVHGHGSRNTFTRVSDTTRRTYRQGDFKEIVFGRFPPQKQRDEAVKSFAAKKYVSPENGKRIWMSPDRPLEIRAQLGVLYAVKSQLLAWKFTRPSLWVDEHTKTLLWNSGMVLRVNVDGSLLQAEFGDTWEKFLTQGDLLNIIMQRARDKLE